MVGGDGCVRSVWRSAVQLAVLRLGIVITHRRPNSSLDLGVDDVFLAVDHWFPAT
jgi:hypothetical protein